MGVLAFLLFLVLVIWGREAWIHRRALREIPIRIHVNGSRGKSSVTRLIAAALREGGIRTAAKTTGSKARFIHIDGREEPVIRLSTPNICEQIGILERARREGAKAIVMECMAVRPDLQKVCEDQIMRSTVGVITNIRPDHLDVMGPTVDDVAVALSSTIPRRAHAILGDDRYETKFRETAALRGSSLAIARPTDVPAGGMNGFAYLEHEENVATALQVTRLLEVPDDVALRGMYKSTPDIGACTFWRIPHRGCDIEFVNIFAANDLESTLSIWDRLGFSADSGTPTVALINLRGDRVDRSLQYAEAVESALRADFYILVGGVPGTVQRRFERQVPRQKLRIVGHAQPATIFDSIVELCPGPRTRVGGIGNIGGIGHEILKFATQGGGGGC